MAVKGYPDTLFMLPFRPHGSEGFMLLFRPHGSEGFSNRYPSITLERNGHKPRNIDMQLNIKRDPRTDIAIFQNICSGLEIIPPLSLCVASIQKTQFCTWRSPICALINGYHGMWTTQEYDDEKEEIGFERFSSTSAAVY